MEEFGGGGRVKGRDAAFEMKVLRTIRRFRMTEEGDRVLVALSGGADSTALLACLSRLAPRLHITLAVAHLNHGLRGGEADEDEEFVRRLCAELNLTLICERANLGAAADAPPPNLEEAAREARYSFLGRAAESVGAARIAVGHTRDDQAETFLLRLLRGSGLKGLAGIQPVRGKQIVRPLIRCTRESVESYLAAVRLSHREDSTNRDLWRRRNRVRHELIPYLEKHFNPRAAGALSRVARFCGEAADYLEEQADEAARDLFLRQAQSISLEASKVWRLHPAIRKTIVRRALAECRGSLRGITNRHVNGIVGLCRPGRSGKSLPLPGGGVVGRRHERLIILKSAPQPARIFTYELPIPGRCEVPEAGMSLSAGMEEPAGAAEPFEARLNPELLPEALTVRSRRPGDRYGGSGRRKVKKMLIDARIPLEDRDLLPMVAAGDSVIWIPGFKPAKSFIAAADAGRCVVLKARVRPASPSGQVENRAGGGRAAGKNAGK